MKYLLILTALLSLNLFAQKEKAFSKNIKSVPMSIGHCSLELQEGMEDINLVATLRWKECVEVQSGKKIKGDNGKEVVPGSVVTSFEIQPRSTTYSMGISTRIPSTGNDLLDELARAGIDTSVVLSKCESARKDLINALGTKPALLAKCK